MNSTSKSSARAVCNAFKKAQERYRSIRALGLFLGTAFWKLGWLEFGPESQVRVRVPGVEQALIVRSRTTDPEVLWQVFVARRFEPLLKLVHWKPKLIIDGGAYVGYSAAMFASTFPQAQVFAVEPDISNFEVLCANTIKGVKPLRAGIWGVPGSLKIVAPHVHKWGLQTEATSAADPDAVPAVTIAEILESSGQASIDILKFNVEGAEKDIFSADCGWLAHTRLLMVDLHDHMRPGCTKAVFDSVKKFGFSAQFLNGSREHVIFSCDRDDTSLSTD
jgi:FkbM family methyltransferase